MSKEAAGSARGDSTPTAQDLASDLEVVDAEPKNPRVARKPASRRAPAKRQPKPASKSAPAKRQPTLRQLQVRTVYRTSARGKFVLQDNDPVTTIELEGTGRTLKTELLPMFRALGAPEGAVNQHVFEAVIFEENNRYKTQRLDLDVKVSEVLEISDTILMCRKAG